MPRLLPIALILLTARLLAADASPLLERAEAAYGRGSYAEARHTLLRAATLTKDPEQKRGILERVGEINTELLFSRLPQTECMLLEVQPGDSLSKIADRAGTTVELLKKSNDLEGDTVRLGRRLKVLNRDFSVTVDKSDNTLTLYLGSVFFKQYAVSTGARQNTPVGEFRITDRIVHPTWWHPDTGEAIPFGDARHRIGTHWLGWDRKGFGIHGTDEPDKIGQPVSLGCVRMHNEDVAELHTLLPSGTRIVVKE